MNPEKSIRIDKFLWATRIFKTRSMASDACRKGRVLINNTSVKPSYSVSRNQVIQVRKLPVIYTYEVLNLLEKRIPAKEVDEYIRDITTEEEREKLLAVKNNGFVLRPKGSGRPTKKERRIIDRLNFTNLHSATGLMLIIDFLVASIG
jgi:ribosome-associated heat shock protein Hsp15